MTRCLPLTRRINCTCEATNLITEGVSFRPRNLGHFFFAFIYLSGKDGMAAALALEHEERTYEERRGGRGSNYRTLDNQVDKAAAYNFSPNQLSRLRQLIRKRAQPAGARRVVAGGLNGVAGWPGLLAGPRWSICFETINHITRLITTGKRGSTQAHTTETHLISGVMQSSTPPAGDAMSAGL